MYVSSFRKHRISLRSKITVTLISVLSLLLFIALRFITVAGPFAENKARYLAIDIINSEVSKYLSANKDAFSDIIEIVHTENKLSYARVDTTKLNLAKATLTELINNSLSDGKTHTVNIPLANYLGIPFLSGVGSPVKIKMHPVSRVLIDFENKFSEAGINQTHLSLNLKVKVTVRVILPGMRRSVTVETDIPVGDAIFLGDVPYYYSTAGKIPTFYSQTSPETK